LGENGGVGERHQKLVLAERWGKRSGHPLSFNSFPPVPRSASLLCRLPLLLAALGLAGCGDGGRFPYATEVDEPSYREGQTLLKGNRKQEALAAFLKVIEKRGDDAPESHLEIGLLYLQHINDPLAAIYHFKKFLALRPNSAQAPLVRQRIDVAIREFARTLPAQPLESQLQRVDLIATLDRLKQENESLKQQLADLSAGRTGDLPTVRTEVSVAPLAASPPPASSFNFSLDNIPTVRTQKTPSSPARTPVVQPASPPAKASAAPAHAARKYTVKAGDTLARISQQFYGTRNRWKDIYAANRGVMKSESDLKIGMELAIP